MSLIFQSVYRFEHAPPPDHYHYRSNTKQYDVTVLSSRFWGLGRCVVSLSVTRYIDNDNYNFVIWQYTLKSQNRWENVGDVKRAIYNGSC